MFKHLFLAGVAINFKFKFKICTFNLENFFLSEEEIIQSQGQHLKNKKKVKMIAKIIREIDADIFALTEVGGEKSLNIFNQSFLDDQYLVFLKEGNSDRNIHNGYLVRKSSLFKFKVISNKDRSIHFNYKIEIRTNKNRKDAGLSPYYQSHKFSRDVLELHLYNQEKKSKTPCFIFLTAHLKSQWDREGQDYNGVERRQHEFQELLKIKEERKQSFPEAHIIFLGDFNGNASRFDTAQEFKKLYENNHDEDILELLDLPKGQRCTFVNFNQKGKQSIQQLDYLFLPKELHSNIVKEESGVYYYKNSQNSPIALPSFKNEKERLPSDHYPLLATFFIEK